MKTISIPFSFLFLTIVFAVPVTYAETLRFNTTGKLPLNTPEQTGFMDIVTKEALSRIGIQLVTVHLPAERGLKNANAGIEDGEMSRIAGLEKVYPNLIRVPEKIMDWEFYAFSSKNITLNGNWESLESYSVAFINGWKILENNVPTNVLVTKVKNPDQLFGLMIKRRADVILYERWGGLKFIQEKKLVDVKILEPFLAKREMFIYLHKKHESIVPRLALALRDMKQDGSYEKIVNQVLDPLDQ